MRGRGATSLIETDTIVSVWIQGKRQHGYTYVAEHTAHAITELIRRLTDALVPLCDERRFAIKRAGVLRCTSGRRVIRIRATLPVHCVIDLSHGEVHIRTKRREKQKKTYQKDEIRLDATFTVSGGKAPQITVALDSSGKRRDTQADINAGFIIRSREV